MGKQIEAMLPFAREAAKLQRDGMRWVANVMRNHGIKLVVDFESGFPSTNHLHHFLKDPHARIVYSDKDKRVVRISRDKWLTGTDRNQVLYLECDAGEPEVLLDKLVSDGIVSRGERVGFVLWGFSAFLTDAALIHAAQKLYEWPNDDSILVFQAQVANADLANPKMRRIVDDYRLKLRTEIFVRPLDGYRNLLHPRREDDDGHFRPVLQLLKGSIRTQSVPMQEFYQGAGVGLGGVLVK